MVMYRNTRTREVVDVPDDPSTRTGVAGRSREWARLRTRLDESRRWERFTPSTSTPVEPQKRASSTRG